MSRSIADLTPEERAELVALLEERALRDQAKRAEQSLLEFMKMFWRVVDPEEPFVDGWPLWVICDHLEAVTEGVIKRLILNVPPGFSKSLLTDVFWPAWEWGPQGKPWTRYIAASYSASLTERDNGRFSRLINDPTYQRFWGHVFTLTRDGMTKVENDRTGWKLATSVGGVGTGERGNRVICLPPSGRVLTDHGWLEIGDIVARSLAVKIAGAMPDGSIVWQDIERYERNPAGNVLEIGFAGGALRCTGDHLVAVGPDREWRRADSIELGETIWTHGLDDLPAVRRTYPVQAEPCAQDQILLEAMPVLSRQISRAPGRSDRMGCAVVSHVAVIGRCEETFNLAVTPAHTYFADGVLVHNCDDPNNPKDVESDVVRDSTNQWLREVMPDRLNNLREGAIICIQQRTHEEDATGTLLKYGTNYTHVCIPMRYDTRMPRIPTPIGWVDPREYEGELAWEERFPEEVCDDMEKIKGPFAWSGQYMQSPTPRGGGIIPREMWNLWPAPGYECAEGEKQQFPEVSFVIACVDTASTEKEENDPSACVVFGLWHDMHGRPKIIMMDAWAVRLKINDLVKKLLETGQKRLIDRMIIENKNNGISVHHEMQRLMTEAEFGVELWDPKGHGDKVARLYSAQPTFDRGDVYAPDKKWANKVIDEVLQVPKGAHDDLADCVSMGILWLRESGMLKTAREYDNETAWRNTFQREPEPLYDV